MPVINGDFSRYRGHSVQDRQVHAAADATWAAFCETLIWRPIADYDQKSSRPQLLRNGDRLAFGFWGHAEGCDVPIEVEVMWRDAQDSMDGAPLAFEPAEFAVVADDVWRERLMDD